VCRKLRARGREYGEVWEEKRKRWAAQNLLLRAQLSAAVMDFGEEFQQPGGLVLGVLRGKKHRV
jgi:hypothetical protein